MAAKYSESVEQRQILLQLDVSVTKKRTSHHDTFGHIPLGILCRRKNSPAFMDMVRCLIEVDSGVEVIENAIEDCIIGHSSHSGSIEGASSIIPGSKGHKILALVDMLLKTNSEADKCESKAIVHEICVHIKGDLCKSLISQGCTPYS